MPWVLLALLSMLALDLGATAALLLRGDGPALPGELVLELLYPRTEGLVAATTILLLYPLVSRRFGQALAQVGSLALFTALLWHLAPLGRPGPVAAALAVGVLPALAERLRPALRRWRPAMAAGTVAAAASIFVAAPADWASTRANRLGLVAGPPSRTVVLDDTRNPVKDGYPICRFVYNSLGYRDIEPAPRDGGRRRVLVVGDSFVWGDGIPDAEGTLPALLRAELERRAPGRWDVVGAGSPGNNLYGYSRAARRLAEELAADDVVVGYLGLNDDYPLDPQYLVDRLPARAPAVRALTNLGVLARLSGPPPAGLPAYTEVSRALVAELAAALRARGTRLLFLVYGEVGDVRFPADAAVVTLPAGLRYPLRANDYWYAKDHHPKPALNRLLAPMLADGLQAGAPPSAGIPAR